MTVQCSQGHSNPDGSVFCDECGERIEQQPVPAADASMPNISMPASAPASAARLVVEADNTSLDLAGKTEFLIGREDPISNIYPDVDLTSHGGEEGGVSREHARLIYDSGQYLIVDQNSTNFTFVNRQKLEPKTPTPIKDGDEIRLGRVALRFHTA